MLSLSRWNTILFLMEDPFKYTAFNYSRIEVHNTALTSAEPWACRTPSGSWFSPRCLYPEKRKLAEKLWFFPVFDRSYFPDEILDVLAPRPASLSGWWDGEEEWGRPSVDRPAGWRWGIRGSVWWWCRSGRSRRGRSGHSSSGSSSSALSSSSSSS